MINNFSRQTINNDKARFEKKKKPKPQENNSKN